MEVSSNEARNSKKFQRREGKKVGRNEARNSKKGSKEGCKGKERVG